MSTLGLLLNVSDASAEGFDKVQDVLWSCEKRDPEPDGRLDFSTIECLNYLSGAFGMFVLMANTFHPGMWCPPGGIISSGQIAAIVLKWIRANPERMHEPGMFAVYEAFRAAYPCTTTAPPVTKRRRSQ